MPVINLDRKRLSTLVGQKLTVPDMAKWLPWLGFDIEEENEDSLKVEYNPNRIDFASHVGIARALKGLRGWEVGLPKYQVHRGNIVLRIEETVSQVRPFMLGAIVRNIKLSEDTIVDLMEMQEDLHWGVGRDREKASIGVHNLDAVQAPFTYTAAEPESVKFIPLDETREMTLSEVLRKHEKGMKYADLVEWAPKYPLLIDNNNEVLSMPPIINGELTRVDEKTSNLFLDVTGTELSAVEKSLKLFTTALADMGGKLEKIKVEHLGKTIFSPDLRPEKASLRTDYANELLGVRLSDSQIIEALERCRLGVQSVRKGIVEVTIPPYRIDILHEVDLVEEVAIGYGYQKLKPTFPSSVTIGQQHPVHRRANQARQILAGLGYLEVMNFTLTNEANHFKQMRKKAQKTIKIANPVSTEYTILRQKLIPGLMKNLKDNKHESFPQRLYEVSDVVQLNNESETRCKRRLHAAAVSSHSNTSFTEIRAALEALLSNLGLTNWTITASNDPSFIPGRMAKVNMEDHLLGVLGEIHPEVLENFHLENPTAAFEVDLETLEL